MTGVKIGPVVENVDMRVADPLSGNDRITHGLFIPEILLFTLLSFNAFLYMGSFPFVSVAEQFDRNRLLFHARSADKEFGHSAAGADLARVALGQFNGGARLSVTRPTRPAGRWDLPQRINDLRLFWRWRCSVGKPPHFRYVSQTADRRPSRSIN